MIEKLSIGIANWLLKNEAIKPDDFDVQVYGIIAVICTAINYLILLGLAVSFHRLAEAAVFLAFYMLLRNFIGGWHASTPLRCAVIGTLLLCAYMVFTELISGRIWVGIIFASAATVLVFLFAPCYIDKDYTSEQMAQLKQKSRIISLLMYGIILIVSFLSDWKYHAIFQTYASMGMFSAVLTMLPVRFCKTTNKI